MRLIAKAGEGTSPVFLRFWEVIFDRVRLCHHFAGYKGFGLTIFPGDVGSDGPYSLTPGNCSLNSSSTATRSKLWGESNPLSV
jgi:hypothetical protein